MTNGSALLVDDDPELMRLFQFTLKRVLGELELAVAWSGEEAIGILRGYTPQVVIVDLTLSTAGSNDLIHFILSQPHLDSTRIVVVTPVPMRLATAGLDRLSDVLTKPVRPRELEFVVSQLLGKREIPDPSADNAV